MAIPYCLPQRWIRYDFAAVANDLVEARAAVMALTTTPYQRSWVDELQKVQLKMEVAGTSRIEGADFTGNELDSALDPLTRREQLLTRSQRQAKAAAETYRWIRDLPYDLPLDGHLIREVHRRIVSGCDDDHCEPGGLRKRDQNVTFGIPRHRGCEGGEPCKVAFDHLVDALEHEFKNHDLLVQASALHYHLAAMHPFLDGNGRTARALEALLLQRAGLRDRAFIAMSNYYYDEKPAYLAALAEVRARDLDLTPFLAFGLRGIAIQSKRLFAEIRKHMQRALFRNTMHDLFNRLKSERKRVIQRRQIATLQVLLEVDELDLSELFHRVEGSYAGVGNPTRAFDRDIRGLVLLEALELKRVGERKWLVRVRLDWPERITESEFFERVKRMPKAKTQSILSA